MIDSIMQLVCNFGNDNFGLVNHYNLYSSRSTRILAQVVYLEGGLGKHQKGVGKWDREGKTANRVFFIK